MPREWTLKELAEQWGVPVSTARHAVRRSGAAERHLRIIGRVWLVSDRGRGVAETWRRENSRRGRATRHQKLRMLAYDWHGGQESALYSFASTEGVVHTEAHRERLVAELTRSIMWCEVNPDTRESADVEALRGLLAFVREAPLKGPEAPLPEE